MLSPVTIFSSTEEWPSVTMPSVAIRSPGLVRKTSPSLSCSAGISDSAPSLMTVAVGGCNAISFLIASVALPRTACSRSRPVRMSAMIMADVSK